MGGYNIKYKKEKEVRKKIGDKTEEEMAVNKTN